MSRSSIMLALSCLLLAACSSGGGGDDDDGPGSMGGGITVQGDSLADLASRGAVSVKYKPTAKTAGFLLPRSRSTAGAVRRWSVQVRWQPDVDRQAVAAACGLQPLALSGREGWGCYRLLGGDPALLRRDLLSGGLASRVLVAPLATQTLVPSDDLYAERQWNLQLIGMERAWDLTTGAAGVRLAVLDSGIDPDHAEFAGRLVDGYDFVSATLNAGDGDGRDPDPTDPVPIDFGNISHGTHVTGIAGAEDDGLGTVGVDHACMIMPVRCIGRLGGDLVDIWDAIIYAADLEDADLAAFAWFAEYFPAGLDAGRPRPTAPADVINMSFGGDYVRDLLGDGIQAYEDILAACRAKGVVVVAAGGNEGTELDDGTVIKLPAASNQAITVNAVGPEARLASYNNIGSAIDLVAPGGIIASGTAVVVGDPESGGVLSTDKSGGYAYLQGTSMAAPHVAGVCALMRALRPELTPEQMEFFLESTALDVGAAGVDPLSGAGLLLADQALLSADGGQVPTQLVLYADSVNLAWSESVGSFAYGDLAGEAADLGALDWSASYAGGASGWISDVSFNDGLASFTAERSGLADGIYEATLSIDSAAGGSDTLRVKLEVLSSDPTSGIDEIFVLLVDAERMQVVAQAVVVVPESVYRFDQVEPGLYLIAAGTDLDGDDFIDDVGEYFGFYSDGNGQGTVQVEPGEAVEGLTIDLTRQGLIGG